MSNSCKNLNLTYKHGAYYNNNCSAVAGGDNYLLNEVLNVNRIEFDYAGGHSGTALVLCTYGLDKKLISVSRYSEKQNNIVDGHNVITLNPSYYYKFSFSPSSFTNVEGYSCNAGIGSMSNDLASGMFTSLWDHVSFVIPFIIVLIGFALGYFFLRKVIKKSSKGSV